MKKHIKVLLTLLVALSFAALASAEDVAHEGTISSIDTIANTFVLKTKSGDVSLYVRPMSHMKLNGVNKALSGIPYGSEAKCTAFMKSEKLTVRDCIVTPKN